MDCKKEKYVNSINLNVDTDFPYLVLDVINDKSHPKNPGFQVMHWHDDLQFIYVVSGTIEVLTLDSIIQVKTGEAVFINKSVVHHVRRINNCHYNSFIFPAYFLEFYVGNPVKSLIDRITENEQFTVYHFTHEYSWCNEVLSILQRLIRLEKSKNELYMYEVLVSVCSLSLIKSNSISKKHK